MPTHIQMPPSHTLIALPGLDLSVVTLLRLKGSLALCKIQMWGLVLCKIQMWGLALWKSQTVRRCGLGAITFLLPYPRPLVTLQNACAHLSLFYNSPQASANPREPSWIVLSLRGKWLASSAECWVLQLCVGVSCIPLSEPQ